MVVGRQAGIPVNDTVFPTEVTALAWGEVGDLIGGLGLKIGVGIERDAEGFALGFVVGFFSTSAEVGRVVPSRVISPAWIRLPDCAWHDERRGSVAVGFHVLDAGAAG